MGPLNDNTGDLPSHPQGQGYYEEASYPSGLTLAPSAPGASSSPDDDGNETGGMRTTTASINNPMLEALTTAAALAAAANDRPGDNELSSSQDNSQATGLQSLAANSSSSDMQPTLSTLRETPKVYKNNPLLLAPATSIPQNHPLAAAHENISMYPFHEQNSPVPPMFLNQKLRHGKWSTEEEDYANALIEIFQSGHAIVNEKNGKTLRAFLSRKLHCSPMRVSKKFKGTKVGKLIFTSKPGSILAMSPIMLERCLARLAETEVKFYKKIFSNYTGQFILANGSPAGAGPALPRPPNVSFLSLLRTQRPVAAYKESFVHRRNEIVERSKELIILLADRQFDFIPYKLHAISLLMFRLQTILWPLIIKFKLHSPSHQ
jgi:hypothetical protein